MTTRLGLFQDAYARVTVATYQPLMLRWVSQLQLHRHVRNLARRQGSGEGKGRASARGPEGGTASPTVEREMRRMSAAGPRDGGRPAESEDTPGQGSPRAKGSPGRPASAGPGAPSSGELRASGSGTEAHLDVGSGHGIDLRTAFQDALDEIRGAEHPARTGGARSSGGFADRPAPGAVECLSPLGLSHFYRQLYFNAAEGLGPIEEAFTVAPAETVELYQETSVRRTREENEEQGFEATTDERLATQTSDELSEVVASRLSQDRSLGINFSTSGEVAAITIAAGIDVNLSQSQEQSREATRRRTLETTHETSQRLLRSMRVSVRATEERAELSSIRRVVRNDSAVPVNYGLRRVLRKVRVVLQYIGPRLVWQVYVESPGATLGQGQFVSVDMTRAIADSNAALDLEPRPAGGVESGATAPIAVPYGPRHGGKDPDETAKIVVRVPATSGRSYTDIAIRSVAAAGEGGGSPAINGFAPLPDGWASNPKPLPDGGLDARISLERNGATSVVIGYDAAWEPSQDIIDTWEARVAAARAEADREAYLQQFQMRLDLLKTTSKVRPRPAADLREEERYAVLSHIAGIVAQEDDDGDKWVDPTPYEIELFHQLFDLDGVFLFMHPAWWRPRRKARTFRPHYPITQETDPAPLGKSLGWDLQLDGDRRRNEFINSPWVRACIPIRPGREGDAVAWLAEHVEGRDGFQGHSGEVDDLLRQIGEFREKEAAGGGDGPDLLFVSGEGVAFDSEQVAQMEQIYPVVADFEVTVPTRGFVYDDLHVDVAPEQYLVSDAEAATEAAAAAGGDEAGSDYPSARDDDGKTPTKSK